MVLKNPSEQQKGKTIVYFVRHGDVQDKDIPAKLGGPSLSPLGRKQAKSVAKKFAKIKDEIDIFYSSTLNRALETAEEISKKINKKPKKCDALCEFSKILWTRRIYHYKFWKHYLKHRLSLKELDKILDKNEGKVIVIVAHGNVIKGLVGNKLGLSRKQIGAFDYHNVHISLVRFKGKKLDYIHYFNSKELV